MNFHCRRFMRLWTLAEERELVAYRKTGKTYRYIAKQMNRSIAAVKDRGCRLNRGASLPRGERTEPRPTIVISKSELPEWYAFGWVVRSFDGDQITLEWPHKGLPGGAK